MKSVKILGKLNKGFIHFLLFAPLILCSACSSDDEPGKGDGNLSPEVPAGKFYSNLDGLWYCEGRTMTASDFNEKVLGSAWHVVELRYINTDGTYGENVLDPDNTVVGLGDYIWLFEEGKLTNYVMPDYYPLCYYRTAPYEISDPVGYFDKGNWSIIPIGMLDDDHLEIIWSANLWYLVLERLSESEQKALSIKYVYNYDDIFDEEGNLIKHPY